MMVMNKDVEGWEHRITLNITPNGNPTMQHKIEQLIICEQCHLIHV